MINCPLTPTEPVERGGSVDAALRMVQGYVGGQADAGARNSVTAGLFVYSRDDDALEDLRGDIDAALLSVEYHQAYRLEPAATE